MDKVYFIFFTNKSMLEGKIKVIFKIPFPKYFIFLTPLLTYCLHVLGYKWNVALSVAETGSPLTEVAAMGIEATILMKI